MHSVSADCPSQFAQFMAREDAFDILPCRLNSADEPLERFVKWVYRIRSDLHTSLNPEEVRAADLAEPGEHLIQSDRVRVLRSLGHHF